jgi:hypothetical protein
MSLVAAEQSIPSAREWMNAGAIRGMTRARTATTAAG